MKNKKRKKGTFWIVMGNIMLLAALLLGAFNVRQDFAAGESVRAVIDSLKEDLPDSTDEETTLLPTYMMDPDQEMPVKMINGQEYIGVLTIPSLDLELPIIGEWSYPRLRISPCRYTGSVYRDDMILMAHNYAAHFGKIRNLQAGDEVLFTDMENHTFTYEVVETEILMPKAVEEMESGEWDLTLFTCTLGGRTRVTVRCERQRFYETRSNAS